MNPNKIISIICFISAIAAIPIVVWFDRRRWSRMSDAEKEKECRRAIGQAKYDASQYRKEVDRYGRFPGPR